MKKIGIITTGGDCSGLNTTIWRLVTTGLTRGYEMIGIIDGTDGLVGESPKIIKFDFNTLPVESARLSGSWLRNGCPFNENFRTAAQDGEFRNFQNKLKSALKKLKLDALILLGGNGSISLAYKYSDIYSDLQLICIPKTIDMDIPLTDSTLGFATAVQQLTNIGDQLLLNARSHHRWFVLQTMGRDTGHLALNSGIALGADAILIPEIKFKPENLMKHIQKIQTEQNRDYGIIVVSEGIKLRGHSGEPAEMIQRELTRAGINSRTSFPEHIQRSGDTIASDKLLATQMAICALDAVENRETLVMVTKQGDICKTVPISEMFKSGEINQDPNIPEIQISNSYVQPDNPLLSVAANIGIYIGEIK